MRRSLQIIGAWAVLLMAFGAAARPGVKIYDMAPLLGTSHPFDTSEARAAFYLLAPGAVPIPAPAAHLKLYDM